MGQLKTENDYRNLAAERGFEWIATTLPKDTKTPTKWECLLRRHPAGHSWKTMKSNGNCRQCHWDKKRESIQFDRRTKEGKAAYARYWSSLPGNSERVSVQRRAKHAEFRAENPLPPTRTVEEIAAQKSAWNKADRETYPEKYQAKSKREYEADKENIGARHAKRYAENQEEIRAIAKTVRDANPEIHRAAAKKYRQENPAKGAARRAKWRAKLKQRTPEWVDLEAIEFFFEYCPEGCDVDHIAPLQGEIISGLHVVENIQWLPALANKAKGNYWNCDELAMADYMRRLIRDYWQM